MQVPLSAEEKSKQEQAPEKLAIGGDSGFQVDSPSYNIDKHSELILLGSDVKVPLPCPELPELVINAVSAIQVWCIHFSMMPAASSEHLQYYTDTVTRAILLHCYCMHFVGCLGQCSSTCACLLMLPVSAMAFDCRNTIVPASRTRCKYGRSSVL